MPFRPQAPRALLVALSLTALAVAGRLPAAPARCAAPLPPRRAEAPAEADAGPIAINYLKALADHRYDQAQTFAHACTIAQQRSLDQLWLWLDSMPTQAIKVADPRIESVKDGVTVQATRFARFGPKPYSAWVTLGPKTLRLSQARRSRRVRSLCTLRPGRLRRLLAAPPPLLHQRERVTVVYAKPADVTAAQQILDTAESVVPGLVDRYGGGKAGFGP